MSNFHLGCAVWSYKGWVGEFYPPKSKPSEFLRLYSQRFTTVEGNTTFYAVPNANIIARWVEETPSGFKFCPKLPKTVTHSGLLQPLIPEALNFIQQMQGLGDRLGVIFAQLPPFYSPVYLEDLTAFLTALPLNNISLALEVRHLDWFQDSFCRQLQILLEDLGIGRVLLDTRPIYNASDDPQIHSERRKPQLPLSPHLTANFSLIRFISHPQQEYNQPYLQEWGQQIQNWLQQGKEIYFFVHCPIEEHSPHNARYFQRQLEADGVMIPPIPWDNLQPIPKQLSLF